MPPIRLDELESNGQLVRLDDATAIALVATGLVDVRPEGFGTVRIRPAGKVGAVRIGPIEIVVVPKEKVGLSRLLFLLGYAKDPGWRDEDVTAVKDDDLWPALAATLVRQAERALFNGVLQGYRTVNEALQTVRGRIRISDQLSKRPGMMVPLEVSYDEFTHDITENRILRTALRRMLAVPGLAADSRARLAHLDARLSGVQILRSGSTLPAWSRTRLNSRYHSVLRLAEIILRDCSTELGAGAVAMAAFVVSMPKVFEDFVATALTESLASYPGHTEAQYQERLDVPDGAPGKIALAIDVVHVVNNRPRLIFDAKYKVADASGNYPNADHYQMLAYCTALRVAEAWLVYAKGSSAPTERRIVNTAISVIEYPLDLSSSPHDLLDQIENLADAAWRRAHPASAARTKNGPAAATSRSSDARSELRLPPSTPDRVLDTLSISSRGVR